MTGEPLSTFAGVLIAALVHEVATHGFELLRERFNNPVYHPIVEPVQLHSGRNPTTRAQVDLSVLPVGSLQSPWQPTPRPYWMLLGIQNRAGKRHDVPALYGEPIDLIVDSDEYDLAALFFNQPRTFNELPTLQAISSDHALLISRRIQPVKMIARYPSDQEIAWLAKQAPPSGLRFKLPPITSQRVSSLQRQLPALTGLRTSRLDQIIQEQARKKKLLSEHLFQTRQPTKPLPTLPELTRRTPPQAPKKPPSSPVYDTRCKAHTRRGQRCQLLAQSARGGVCDMHLHMVAEGKRVLWHESGSLIQLKKR